MESQLLSWKRILPKIAAALFAVIGALLLGASAMPFHHIDLLFEHTAGIIVLQALVCAALLLLLCSRISSSWIISTVALSGAALLLSYYQLHESYERFTHPPSGQHVVGQREMTENSQ